MRRNPGQAILLTLAILGVPAAVALGARWSETSTGLPQGAVALVTTLAVDSQSGSTLYARTASESIFKSTDRGETWKALSSIAGVRVLALDPTSASTIYAGTGRGILKSTNGGESWRFAGLSDRWVSHLVVDPVTPSTVYAAASASAGPIQMYKSTDGGEGWITLSLDLPPFAGISSIILDPLTPSTLYVLAGSVGFAMYKSTDGGESWIVIDPGPFNYSPLVIDPVTPSTLYAIRFASGLSKSTDGGASWTATGFTKAVGPLTIDPRNSNILYAATSGPNLSDQVTYKSRDGGKSWNALDPSFPNGRLIFDPANASIFYALTLNGVLSKSTDAGARWTEINNGRRALDIRLLTANPVDPATIYAGGSDGLFKSVDSGGSWQKHAAFDVTLPPPGGIPFPPSLGFPPVAPAAVRSLLIDFTDPNILYVATARLDGCLWTDKIMFKSADGGATWRDDISPSSTSGCLADGLMAMDPTDPNTLYLRWGNYEGYGILKSTDGGAHWDYSTGLGSELLDALVIDPSLPTTLYAGTDRGVFQSTDGGAKWNPIGLATANVNLLAIDPLQPNILYAGTNSTGAWQTVGSRGLFKSTDSGANWSPINNGLADVLDTRASVNALILDPDHTDTLYLGTSGYGVFKSSDGGTTWAPFNDGLSHLDVRVLTLTRGASPTVYAGTPGGVFKMEEIGN